MVNSTKLQDKRNHLICDNTTGRSTNHTNLYDPNKTIINLELKIELRELYIECIRSQYIKHRNKEKGSVTIYLGAVTRILHVAW